MSTGLDSDVIIVGGGPAGSTAAYILGRAGVRTLIVDRAEFPRRKPCGGGIPCGTRSLFDFPFPEPSHTTKHNRRYFAFEREATVRDRAHIEMVDRRDFDDALLKQAIEWPSVAFRGSVNVRTVETSDDGVVLTTRSGETLRAAFVVGADGASSIVARSLGLVADDRPAVALDVEIRVPDEVYEQHKDYATFHFGVIEAGYAWVFPKDDVLSCGIGSWTGEGRLHEALDNFLAKVFPGVEYEVVYRAGQALPLYSSARQCVAQRTFLVGDAAGMVDPVFGEGIRYAMLSGKYAGESIVGAVESGDYAAATKAYEARANEKWGDRFRAQRALAFRDLTEAPEFFYRTFIEKGIHYDQWYKMLFDRQGS